MEEELPPPDHFALIAALFEAFLVFLAVGLGWLFGFSPMERLRWDISGLGWGLVATLPALLLFWLCLICPWKPLAEMTRIVDRRIVPMFRDCRVGEMAAISLLAGIGEELLFRGLLQGGVANYVGGLPGIWLGLLVGGVVFGLAHPVSKTYAIIITLIGFYLGGLYLLSGNLLAPITTHAVYDWLVLVYLTRVRSRRDTEPVD